MYINHTLKIWLEDRDGNKLQEAEQSGWGDQETQESFFRKYDGEEYSLWRDEDGEDEFDYRTEERMYSALYFERVTVFHYGENYVGRVVFVRECDWENDGQTNAELNAAAAATYPNWL